jgi:hypothetical protein
MVVGRWQLDRRRTILEQVRRRSAPSTPKPRLRIGDHVSVEGVVPPTPHIRLRTPREVEARNVEATAEPPRRNRSSKIGSRRSIGRCWMLGGEARWRGAMEQGGGSWQLGH